MSLKLRVSTPRRRVRLPGILPCVALAAPASQAGRAGQAGRTGQAAAQTKPAAQGSLGSKDPGLFNLTGTIYFLTEKETRMPADLGTRKPEGTIYTDRIDVPVRRFTDGFPGITDRFAWFGIFYTGRFFIDVPGEYEWELKSDDGSRLWIDGKQVIDNDGVHGFSPRVARVQLAEGPHDMRLWYFQGPPTEIGLQLRVQVAEGDRRAQGLQPGRFRRADGGGAEDAQSRGDARRDPDPARRSAPLRHGEMGPEAESAAGHQESQPGDRRVPGSADPRGRLHRLGRRRRLQPRPVAVAGDIGEGRARRAGPAGRGEVRNRGARQGEAGRVE